MTYKIQLDEKWIKASILGTLWASFEIVLGSFLHNLKIPFSGNILTAIALVVLISASYKWKEQGLFWRAGVICALLKTMSPSAVIFGPMIAIVSEAFLLEISVRLFGKTIFGYIFGSALCMSWVLFQRGINFIIFYGYNIVEIYENLMMYAQKQFNWQFDAVWMPILLLVIINTLFGGFAAILGIRTGRKLGTIDQYGRKQDWRNGIVDTQKKNISEFSYSLVWLAADFIMLVGSLIMVNYLPFVQWTFIVVGVATVWAMRYKRALRQLVRPKFWVFFVIVTMITAFVSTEIQTTDSSVFDGFIIGVEMNLRAMVLIMGFSVLGNELYNPKIRNFFKGSYFKQLPLALELSLESLPSMLTHIPELKVIVKNPVWVMAQIISQAEWRLSQIKDDISGSNVFILTDAVGSGKTTYVQEIITKLKQNNIPVGGIYSSRIMKDNMTFGYDVVDIINNNSVPFLRINRRDDCQNIGRFHIIPEGLEKGLNAIKVSRKLDSQITIIDEVGALEVDNGGWASEIDKLLPVSNNNILLLVVREEYVQKTIRKWNLNPLLVYHVSKIKNSEFCELIV